MTEHKRNIWVTDCLEAVSYYNSRYDNLPSGIVPCSKEIVRLHNVIAEAYLMRVESLTSYNS